MDRLFSAIAAHTGVVLRNATTAWDAATLLSEVECFARQLADCRVLAVLADNSPAWVMADLAALRAERAHLPLPTFFTQKQLAHALVQTGADALLTDQPERLEALGLGYTRVDHWHGLIYMRRPCAAVTLPTGTAKISYTSGSTVTPKGVCLSAHGLLGTAEALVDTLGYLPITRHLAVLPLALLLENVAGVYAPLLRGATIILPRLADLGWRGMTGFDAQALQDTVAHTRPHSMILVPELLKTWLTTPTPGVDSLRFIAMGGARCDTRMLATARQRGLPVYEGYGLTECGSVVSLNHPAADRLGGVGRTLAHVHIRVDAGHEIHIHAPGFLGYLSDGAVTECFATGDLGELDLEGYLHLSGRKKNLLITGFGRNIAPEWIEAALTAQPEIAQALCLGEARPWLAAIIVAHAGVDAHALAAAIERSQHDFPDYARIRAWIPGAPFTPQNGCATGNGRPIRSAILTHHAAAITNLYAHTEPPHVVL